MKILTADNRMMCGNHLYTVTATAFPGFARVTVTKGREMVIDRNRAGDFDQTELEDLATIALLDGLAKEGLKTPPQALSAAG